MDELEHRSLDAGEASTDVIVSWDGVSLACYSESRQLEIRPIEDEQALQPAPEEHESPLPELPEGIALLSRVYWPLESLLVRTFSLPLSETRLLDADILYQELAESSGEDSGCWWLAWHAEKSDEGIAGIVFGLPQHLQQAMADDPVWQSCPQLVVDGWERLAALCADRESCALIDEDADGVFFGLLKRGVWRGVRRVNRNISKTLRLSDAEIAQHIRHSWKAMGFEADDEVVGRLGQPLNDALIADKYNNWQVRVLEALSGRHSANFDIDNRLPAQLNFRHGKWRPEKSWQLFKPWKRPLAMAAGLLLIWLSVIIVNIYSLEAESEAYRSDIEASFHRGLPDERVMLDPLAQLKKAGGSSGKQQENMLFMKQLQVLSEVHQKHAWQLHEITFRNGKMQISGSAKDIGSLNQIRDSLQSKSEHEVVIVDTDLSDNRITFRMKW